MRRKKTIELLFCFVWVALASPAFAQTAMLDEVAQAKSRTDLIFTIGFPVAIALYLIFSIYRRRVKIKKMELGEDWLPHRAAPLTLRLSDRSLNRIKIGDHYETLKPLGRPDNESPVYHNQFEYQGSGLAISLLDGEIVDFDFDFRNTAGPAKPARLTLSGESGELELSQGTRLEDVKAFLPNPGSEEKYDNGGGELIYDYGRDHLDFFFDDAGRLEELMIFQMDLDEKSNQ